MSALPTLPDRARVVVVGGGVIGCSVAYHLAREGWDDVVLLEQHRLTAGSTWHAAGLMTCFGSLSETSTRIRLYSRDLYAALEAETGQATGFRPVGLIEAAADRDRLEEYRRVAAFQRHLGLEVHEITPAEIAERFCWADTAGLLAGFYVPGDGRVNPVDLTAALAAGARRGGVRIVEGVRVTDVALAGQEGARQVAGVRTDAGAVECEYVVNCAGMWTRELAARSGVVVPNQAAEHYYLITDTIAGLPADAPVFEDPSRYGYFREEGGGMMVGLFEPAASPWRLDGVPRDFSFGRIPPDWDRVAPYLERAMSRVPVTLEAGVRTLFCGPESFTPDLSPAVGEAPGIRGYFVAAGLNSVGVLSAGGLGRVLAHWIVAGVPDVDVTGIDLTRFRPDQLEPGYRAARTAEILGTVYAAHTPGRQLTSGRGRLRSPVHDRLAAGGAWFRDVSGWEAADWFAGAGAVPQATPTWAWAPWFDHWRAEHDAVREAVGLIDLSFMAKIEVSGPDAGPLLDRLSAGAVDGPAGLVTYTPWLDEHGRVLADLTVTKLAPDRFLVVASDVTHRAVLARLRRRAVGAGCSVTDLTTRWALLSVAGPRSRDLLAGVTSTDLGNRAHPFRAARRIEVAGVEAWCVRVSYTGELGYELYLPADRAAATYDALSAAGATHGLRPVGLQALSSLRLEKGYRDYGHDVDNTDTVDQAGLGFAVALDKPGGFVGRGAVAAARAAGPPARRLVQVLLADPEPLLFAAEVVRRDGAEVGYLRSASYGWTLGGAVGLAMVATPDGSAVTEEWLGSADWEVDVAGRRYPSVVSLRPRYDPPGDRLRC